MVKFLIVLFFAGKIYVWQGANSVAHQQQMAHDAAKRLATRLPAELGLGDSATVSTMNSGSESTEVLSALKGTTAQLNQMFGRFLLDRYNIIIMKCKS